MNVTECEFGVFNFSIFINFHCLDFMTHIYDTFPGFTFSFILIGPLRNENPVFTVSLNQPVFFCYGKMHFGQIFCLLSEVFLQELFSCLLLTCFHC